MRSTHHTRHTHGRLRNLTAGLLLLGGLAIAAPAAAGVLDVNYSIDAGATASSTAIFQLDPLVTTGGDITVRYQASSETTIIPGAATILPGGVFTASQTDGGDSETAMFQILSPIVGSATANGGFVAGTAGSMQVVAIFNATQTASITNTVIGFNLAIAGSNIGSGSFQLGFSGTTAITGFLGQEVSRVCTGDCGGGGGDPFPEGIPAIPASGIGAAGLGLILLGARSIVRRRARG